MRTRALAVLASALLAVTAAAPRGARAADPAGKSSNGNGQPQTSPNTGDNKKNGSIGASPIYRMPVTNLPFDAGPSPSVDGVYRSRRYGSEAPPPPRREPTDIAPAAEPKESPTPEPAKEGSGDATIDEARESLPSMIATFVAHRSKGGFYSLPDYAGGGRVAARFLSVDARSIRKAAEGRYAATVRFLDEGGRRVDADAEASLAGDAWTVLKLARRRAADPAETRRCFETAVKKRVAKGSKRGVFLLDDADRGLPWKLKLKGIRGDTLAPYGASGLFACVDFLDAEGGRSVDVDFYASRGGKRCAVDQMVVHRVDGKARTIKPKPAGAH